MSAPRGSIAEPTTCFGSINGAQELARCSTICEARLSHGIIDFIEQGLALVESFKAHFDNQSSGSQLHKNHTIGRANYLGGNVGYGWRNSFRFPEAGYSSLNVTNIDPALPSSRHTGGTFDVGFGYNRQHGWFVWGLDYEFQYANLGGTPNYRTRYFALPRTATTTTSTTDFYGNIIDSTTSTTSTLVPYTALYDATDGDSNKWYGIIRLRGGIAFDRLLLFATGGAAYRLSYNYTDPYVINPDGTINYYSGINHQNNWGTLVGGGLE